MLKQMDSYELSEWEIYAGMEPFGQLRGDLQAGIIASLVANMFRDSKKNHKPLSPSDFILQFKDPTAEQSDTPQQKPWEEIMFNLQILSARQDVIIGAPSAEEK